MTQKIHVTDPINNSDEIGMHTEVCETESPEIALAEAFKSALIQAGYTSVLQFLSHDENWINIEFVTEGGGKVGAGLPIVRTLS